MSSVLLIRNVFRKGIALRLRKAFIGKEVPIKRALLAPRILGGTTATSLCLLGFTLSSNTGDKGVEDTPSRINIKRKDEEVSEDSSKPTRIDDPHFPWLQFFEYLTPHMGYFIIAVSSAVLAALLNTQIPLSLGDIVNVLTRFISYDLNREAFMEEIRESARNLVISFAAQSLFTLSYIYSLSCLGERIAASMRKDCFLSIISQDVAFFDENKTGEIISRLSEDIQEFKSSFKLVISQGLRNFAQAGGSILSMFWISPEMTAVMGITVPSVIFIGAILGSFLRKLSKDAQAQVSKATSVAEECISNIRVVRAFAMESSEADLYSTEVNKSQKLNEKLGLGIGAFQGATNFFINGIVLGTLTYGGYLMSNNDISAGQLMSFLVASQTLQRSINHFSLLFGQFVRGLSSGSRVFEYINAVPTIPISGGKRIPYHSLLGDIQFRNVSFAYPSRPEKGVLENFSLRIPPGSTVALVGASGGGKSTIAALLERFYDVGEKGSITIDGVDIRELDPKWLRGSAIGFINQEPVLFATSILENIRYGKPTATDQEVMEAAKTAHAHEFIQSFPRGYDTLLGERGVTVSGGQKQRIAIARALLKNPSILILDEATSALDAQSERYIQEALEKLSKGRTALVIAHRLSTVKNADIIAVIDKGVIAEFGTHSILKRKGGLYYNLIRQQEFRSE